ncbi:MAG: hypothetical protein ACI9MR_000763, partial [Myxococcota bacterium]
MLLSALTMTAFAAISPSAAHAQLDPISVRLSPDESSVRRGEVLTFDAQAINFAGGDLLRSDASGGVAIAIEIPLGFRFKSGVVELIGGQTVKIDAPDAIESPALLLPAGRQFLNLGQGQTIRVRYQLIAGSAVKANTIVRHRVQLVDSTGAALSSEVNARIRVEPDPEFDEGIVIGKVFCDADGDGVQDTGELGLGGARVLADTGWYADTDRAGQYHLRSLKPGNHLIKLDKASLPPGSKLTTSERDLIYVTRGLPTKVNFGVVCGVLTDVRPDNVTRIDTGEASAMNTVKAGPLPVVTLSGGADDLLLRIDATNVPATTPTLGILAPRRLADGTRATLTSVNVPWRPGPLTQAIVFQTKFEGPADPARPWRLEVHHVDGDTRTLARAFFGRGDVPTQIPWDGTEAAGVVTALQRGGVYDARLVVGEATGTVASAPLTIGASHGFVVSKKNDVTLRRGLFLQKTMTPRGKVKTALARAKRALARGDGGLIVVEVHTDVGDNPAEEAMKSRRAAYAIQEYAQNVLKLPKNQFYAVGLGGSRPLRPNIGERNRAFNRRVEIIVLPKEAGELPAPPVAAQRRGVTVQGKAIPLEADGRFVYTSSRPEGRPLSVVLTSPTGARRTVLLGDVGVRAPVAPVEPETEAPREVDPAAPAVDAGGALVVPDSIDITTPKLDPAAETLRSTEPAGLAKLDVPEVSVRGPGTPLAEDPLRRFGGQQLREALGSEAVMVGQAPVAAGDGPPVTAGDLQVALPPKGVALSTMRLFVNGTTHTNNTITINGKRAVVRDDGVFDALVDVPSGNSDLVILSRDKSGHEARIVWPIIVSDSEFFLLALADGVGGQVGARLQELDTYHKTDDGSLFLAGRGALYAKGRISGTSLAKDIFVTAHVDSTKEREFEAFYDQVIDPARDYVIFGDASEDVQDVNARGKFYILVEADKSKFKLGSFHTNIEGLHLLRYNRTYYGGLLDVDTTIEKGFDFKLKAFVSEDNRELVRRHDEVRATGGSLYYLSSKEIVAGSEQVSLVVREVGTQMELGRVKLNRQSNYRVDYQLGRITFAGPVSSTMDSLFQIDGHQPFTGRSVLDGHEVWVVVDYESRAVSAAGNVAFGGHMRQEIAGVVEIGGGYVSEGRPAGVGDGDTADYQLFGVDLKVKIAEKTQVTAEWSRSIEVAGVSRVSTDGGLAYGVLSRAGGADEGDAFRLGLDSDVGELFEVEGLDLDVRGWWQLLEEGYHSTGMAYQQGTEKWGGEAIWKITHQDRLQLRYDGGTVLVVDQDFDTGFRAVKRNRVIAHYERDFGPAEAFVEAGYGQHRDDFDGAVHDTGSGAIGVRWHATDDLTLSVSQEALLSGDDDYLGEGYERRLTTNVGLDYSLTDDIALRLGQSVRWNGDSATRFGFRTKMEGGGSMYFEDRLQHGERNGRLLHSMVVGADQPFGETGDGRVFSEYRLDSGVGGRTNRAVMGLAKRFQLADGVKVTAAYERNQAVGGFDAGASRDTISGGLEIVAPKVARFGGLYEVRYDRGGPGDTPINQVQALARNALDLKLGGDFTIMGIVNYTITQDLDSREFAREELEATAGLAYRPLSVDWLALIVRYSRAVDRERSSGSPGLAGLGGLGGLSGAANPVEQKTVTDLGSIAAIFELPGRLQLTEKIAYRHMKVDVTELPQSESDMLFWINRLAFNLVAD